MGCLMPGGDGRPLGIIPFGGMPLGAMPLGAMPFGGMPLKPFGGEGRPMGRGPGLSGLPGDWLMRRAFGAG